MPRVKEQYQDLEEPQPVIDLLKNAGENSKVEYKVLTELKNRNKQTKETTVLNTLCEANYVKTPFAENHPSTSGAFGLIIATRAPVFKIMQDFWQMSISQNVKMMINVAARGDFDQYFPPNSIDNLVYGNLTVKTINIIEKSYYNIRDIEVHDTQTGYKHVLEHIHFFAWPDMQVPKEEAMPDLIKIVDKAVVFLESTF